MACHHQGIVNGRINIVVFIVMKDKNCCGHLKIKFLIRGVRSAVS